MFLLRGLALALPLLPLCAVILPLARISGEARRRRESIDRDLPDFLDILAVTVTAGISFRAAMVRVADRFEGPMQSEIQLTLDQLSHGASLRVAFGNLDRRSGSVAVHSFVSAFLQAEELGAPLAETLNQIAVDMRRENAQRMRRTRRADRTEGHAGHLAGPRAGDPGPRRRRALHQLRAERRRHPEVAVVRRP